MRVQTPCNVIPPRSFHADAEVAQPLERYIVVIIVFGVVQAVMASASCRDQSLVSMLPNPTKTPRVKHFAPTSERPFKF